MRKVPDCFHGCETSFLFLPMVKQAVLLLSNSGGITGAPFTVLKLFCINGQPELDLA